MFQGIGEVLKRRLKELHIDSGINEQIVLSLTEDFLKQNDFFLCFPKSFKGNELMIICSKSVLANELNDQKNKLIDFLKGECPDIKINKVLIKTGYSN
jgi:hypothetical protein